MTATAPTAIPAIAPAESVEEVVVDVSNGAAEVTAGEVDAGDRLDVAVVVVLLVVLLELEVMVELELELELDG